MPPSGVNLAAHARRAWRGASGSSIPLPTWSTRRVAPRRARRRGQRATGQRRCLAPLRSVNPLTKRATETLGATDITGVATTAGERPVPTEADVSASLRSLLPRTSRDSAIAVVPRCSLRVEGGILVAVGDDRDGRRPRVSACERVLLDSLADAGRWSRRIRSLDFTPGIPADLPSANGERGAELPRRNGRRR
jgi:hypothetical protein